MVRGGGKPAGAGEDAIDDRDFGDAIERAHELRNGEAMLVTQLARRTRGWSGR